MSEWVRGWVRGSVTLYLVDTIAATVFDQSLSNFTCKLWMMRKGTLLIFGSRGQRSRSTLALCVSDLVDTIATTVFAQSLSNFTCKLWMMRGGTLLIWCQGVKSQGQLWYSVYKTLWAQYRLQFLPNYFQTLHVDYGWWREDPYWFWVMGS